MGRWIGSTMALMIAAFVVGDLAVAAETQQPAERPLVTQNDDGTINAGELVFASWQEYVASDFFLDHGLRCATVSTGAAAVPRGGGAADCGAFFTNPDEVYDPSVILYRIPVVVHVIRNSTGTQGNISEAMVQSQIDILNEDFLALLGTNGQNGTDIQIEFLLATQDPGGSPTNGITYSNNSTWFNDGGSYWISLAWDTNRYLNIYTNTASGALGYVPGLPQDGIVGLTLDRVVVLWTAFGRNAPIGLPYNQGRTATHEVGHYLGLEHTFNGGCASASGCYSNGDLICDTNPEGNPTFGCHNTPTCGSNDPYRNYMDYSDDLCMQEFTFEQARRLRCTLEHWRPNLYEAGEPDCFEDSDCADRDFCNGAETCTGGVCVAGSYPCGAQLCDEVNDVCVDCLDSTDCDDGAFCNGAETCSAGTCVNGSDPCPGQGCDEGGDVCIAPANIVSARSCMTHNPDRWCLDLDGGAPEARWNPTQLELDLSGNVANVGVTMNCATGHIGSPTVTIGPGPNGAQSRLTVDFAALPKIDCCRLTFSGDVTDQFEFQALAGDVNGSGIVNATDKNLVKGAINKLVNANRFVLDVNNTGAINATDKNLTKGWMGSSAMSCP
ncbi:MAG: hypothetical protein GY778_00395 [bacterium]|nr:hypothetical protein [bacterium]